MPANFFPDQPAVRFYAYRASAINSHASASSETPGKPAHTGCDHRSRRPSSESLRPLAPNRWFYRPQVQNITFAESSFRRAHDYLPLRRQGAATSRPILLHGRRSSAQRYRIAVLRPPIAFVLTLRFALVPGERNRRIPAGRQACRSPRTGVPGLLRNLF